MQTEGRIRDIRDYLRKAKEADEQAENAKDLSTKEAWEHIAASYRELASFARYPVPGFESKAKNPARG